MKLPMNSEFSEFSECSLFNKIRHWLVGLIAQDHVVILNAKISIVQGEDILVRGIDGLLLKGNDFCTKQNETLKIEKSDNGKSSR